MNKLPSTCCSFTTIYTFTINVLYILNILKKKRNNNDYKLLTTYKKQDNIKQNERLTAYKKQENINIQNIFNINDNKGIIYYPSNKE
jgi:hypothetical protein